MSTATINGTADSASAGTRVASRPVTITLVIKSEWIKFRSLRSSWAVLGTAVVEMLFIGLVVAFNTRHLTTEQDPNDLAPSATLQGYYLGQLLVGSLGVLFVSSEFGTGMIGSSFTASPRRLPVLWAKLAVFLAVTAIAMTATTCLTFIAAQALIGQYRTGLSLSDPGVWRVVLGTSLYMTIAGIIGAMIGWIVRSTPGSLVTFFALVFVLPVLNLFGSAGRNAAQFLPSQAGAAFATSIPEPPHLTPGSGLSVLIGWVAVGIAVAAISLRRRDA